MELQKLSREVFSEELFRSLGRDLGRAMQELSRELGHFSPASVGAGAFGQDKNYKFEQADKQTKTLAIGASGTLELRNVVGDIVVKAGGGRDATVEIVRTSKGLTDADAKLGLQRVTVDVVTRDNRANVATQYPDDRRPNYAVSVAYTVTAPAGTRVSVQTITGTVTLSGIKGETSVNTTTGAIDIAQAGALTSAHSVTGRLVIRDSQGDALDVGTMSGQVQLTNVKARRLEVNAVVGPITLHEIQAGGAEVTSMSGEIEYSGAVAPGGRYEFQAHSGEIRLALSGSFDFEGRTFSGRVDPDPSLGLKATAQNQRIGYGPQRQSVKGTVGGGGAFVQATTFSGHVRLGRKLGK